MSEGVDHHATEQPDRRRRALDVAARVAVSGLAIANPFLQPFSGERLRDRTTPTEQVTRSVRPEASHEPGGKTEKKRDEHQHAEHQPDTGAEKTPRLRARFPDGHEVELPDPDDRKRKRRTSGRNRPQPE